MNRSIIAILAAPAAALALTDCATDPASGISVDLSMGGEA